MKRSFLLFAFLLLLSNFGASALDSVESTFLTLINQYRNQSDQCYDSMNQSWQAWPAGSSRDLTEAPSLSSASRTHNQTMIAGNCFSHQCPGEAPFDERALNAGYPGFGFLAENIAAGYETAEGAMTGWRNSSGHNQNMLACRARAIGIARDFGAATDMGWHWTTMFGDVIQLGGGNVPVPQPPPPPQPTPQPQPPVAGGHPGQAFDLDRNCSLENIEFFGAVDAWIGSSLENISFFQIVDAWIGSTSIC